MSWFERSWRGRTWKNLRTSRREIGPIVCFRFTSIPWMFQVHEGAWKADLLVVSLSSWGYKTISQWNSTWMLCMAEEIKDCLIPFSKQPILLSAWGFTWPPRVTSIPFEVNQSWNILLSLLNHLTLHTTSIELGCSYFKTSFKDVTSGHLLLYKPLWT